MLNLRALLCFVLIALVHSGQVGLGPWEIGRSSTAQGQDIIGETLGRLIAPAVGPVLERAAGEVIGEGIRRGYENGRLLPRPGRGRTRPGNRVPSVQPVVPRQPSEPKWVEQPIEEPAPEAAPPPNNIVVRPQLSPNLLPIDLAMNHILANGASFSVKVIRTEADRIAGTIDQATLAAMTSRWTESGDGQVLSDYRRWLARNDREASREMFLSSHVANLGTRPGFESIVSLARAADSCDLVARLNNDAIHTEVVGQVQQLRDALASIRSGVLDGKEHSVLVERGSNLQNTAVIAELARLLSVQRRDDLFAQLAAAFEKSDAPSDLAYGIVGVYLAAASDAVGQMQLPAGNPSVVLYNPDDSPGPINFVCDQTLQMTLAPGELAPFDQSFVVEFDSGNAGVKRYTISQGLFRWLVEDDGWDLRQKTTVNLTIDATRAPVAFHLAINGEPVSVDAATAVEFSMELPPRLDFDRGLGDGSAKSTLVTPGDFVVGVNPVTSGWDLFRAPSVSGSPATAASIAQQHWAESVASVLRSGTADGADQAIGDLLNAIE